MFTHGEKMLLKDAERAMLAAYDRLEATERAKLSREDRDVLRAMQTQLVAWASKIEAMANR
jgi:hypothetical protein